MSYSHNLSLRPISINQCAITRYGSFPLLGITKGNGSLCWWNNNNARLLTAQATIKDFHGGFIMIQQLFTYEWPIIKLMLIDAFSRLYCKMYSIWLHSARWNVYRVTKTANRRFPMLLFATCPHSFVFNTEKIESRQSGQKQAPAESFQSFVLLVFVGE